MGKYKSSLAKPAFTSKIRKKRNTLFGITVHTTGRGVLDKAKKKGQTPIEWALGYYKRTAGPHYCIDTDGTIYQIQPDHWMGAHVGIAPIERKEYLSGAWTAKFKKNPAYELWKRRWPGYESPQHLYPSPSPNADYIGVELIPLVDATYTDAQYESLANLCLDRAKAHGWEDGWAATPRLVGHEDLDAYDRWHKTIGGWDPGYLRAKPKFHWEKLFKYMNKGMEEESTPAPVEENINLFNKLLDFFDQWRKFNAKK